MTEASGKRTLVRYAGPASKALIETGPIGNGLVHPASAKAAGTQPSVDESDILSYVARNRAPHASASACAPGGTFFACSTGKAGSE